MMRSGVRSPSAPPVAVKPQTIESVERVECWRLWLILNRSLRSRIAPTHGRLRIKEQPQDKIDPIGDRTRATHRQGHGLCARLGPVFDTVPEQVEGQPPRARAPMVDISRLIGRSPGSGLSTPVPTAGGGEAAKGLPPDHERPEHQHVGPIRQHAAAARPAATSAGIW